MNTNYKHLIFGCCSLLWALCLQAQVKPAPFEILSRSAVNGNKAGRLGLSANRQEAGFSLEKQQGKPVYTLQANGAAASIPALGNIELAAKADRVLVYGDSIERHVAFDLYLSLYNTQGGLIRSFGKVAVQPYAVMLTQQGSVVVAGNSGKAPGKLTNFLALYDRQGNKTWEKPLPTQVPNHIYSAPDNRYIVVGLYEPATRKSSLQYYNGQGSLIRTHSNSPSISGIEFLSSGKVVLCSGNTWYLYDLAAGYKLLASGVLPGTAVGRFPVSAYPGKDIFFIVTTNESVKSGYSLQAYDDKGTMLAQGTFDGSPYWQSYRLAEVGEDGTVRLMTDQEIITLKMK